MILPYWVAAGKEGGYLAAAAEPGNACLIERPLPDELVNEADLAFFARALDLRAFQIVRSAVLAQAAGRLPPAAGGMDDRGGGAEWPEPLLSLFGAASFVIRPLARGTEELVPLPGAEPDADVSEMDLYPSARLHASYNFVLAPQPGKLRRCIVTFAESVDRALLSQLAQFIFPWVRLLETGGFDQPTDTPGERSARFGTVQVYDQFSAEIVVDHFAAAEGAWSVLANLLATFALTHPIVSVEIN
ncbi:hypothetical protein [Thauera sp. 2A1]|uniref:hypothetical protein n=1 Tax=Thauera sp. 2A1 TaxID=2570191 RepID=UPI001292B0EE|nr:hypothetical protein [Thauera sp. 2A1]KAI5916445.1 hypothetical protein GH664_03115 [Thauera sp. 2A1]